MASRNIIVAARLATCTAVAAAVLVLGHPSQADDPIGDASYAKIPAARFGGYKCEELWFMRNDIYNMRGYCFKSPKAQAEFDNSDCVSSDPNMLNSYERHNVAVIKRVEKQQGCR